MDEPLDVNPLLNSIARGERIHARARTRDADVVVTDHRLAVATSDRLLLDVPIDNVRRVQFDIERLRPATLVVVPEHPMDEPQVLAIPPESYAEVAEVLVLIGQRIADTPS